MTCKQLHHPGLSVHSTPPKIEFFSNFWICYAQSNLGGTIVYMSYKKHDGVLEKAVARNKKLGGMS